MDNRPTKNGYGPRGDVGVTYVIHQEREKYAQKYGGGVVGTWEDTWAFNVKNMYGVYNTGMERLNSLDENGMNAEDRSSLQQK